MSEEITINASKWDKKSTWVALVKKLKIKSWKQAPIPSPGGRPMRPYRGLKKDGKWVYGWYCFVREREYFVSDTKKEVVPARHFIIDAENTEQSLDGTDPYVYCINEAHEVLPSTVGQATGLKDSRGVEIYEGDIVQNVKQKNIWIIIWDSEHAKFGFQYTSGQKIDERCTLGASGWAEKQEYEIIGNIHDKEQEVE
jgi:uncharacterized phage protein (TIGR01671 family)